ncbi:P-loop containing nucleoside triphosphate hydrolase protein, partial [Talaromyces proteolyticus]
PLVKIENGSFYRSYPSDLAPGPKDAPLLSNVDFILPARLAVELPKPVKDTVRARMKYKREVRLENTVRKLQGPFHWAFIGPGSSTLFDIIRGQHIAVPPNSRSYPYLSSDKFTPSDPKLRHSFNAIQFVGFGGEGSQATGGTRGAYLSARYESLREDTDWTVRQYLKGQTELNPLEGQEWGKIHDEIHFQEIVNSFKLQELLDMPVSNLSNGQTRRTRIAKALLAKPELILLDEPLMGLDPVTSDSISSLLCSFAQKSTPRVIISLRPQDPLPEWITHVAVLNGDHVAYQGDKASFIKCAHRLTASPHVGVKGSQLLRPLFQEGGLFQGCYVPPLDLKRTARWSSMEKKRAKSITPISMNGEPIIQMEGVRVQYGGKVVLGNWKQDVAGEDHGKPGLHWKVRRGQRWAILGANGSGKTTLLSVITSDHPQAYALPVRLFGRSRLPEVGKPGISIFDLQSRIGHSSPEVHAFFPRQLTVRAAIESAWADTFLSKPTLSYEIDTLIDRVLEHFKPELDNSPGPELPIKAETDLSFIPLHFQKKVLAENFLSQRYRYPLPPSSVHEYADTITFGQLNMAQQRLVLFIRAIIKKQDLIILDEAFSGMSPSMREKCFALLEPDPDANETLSNTKFQIPHLGPDQSLIVVSHLRSEIPDSVRFWMRLPSDVGDNETLPFAMGLLPDGINLASDETVWRNIWSVDTLPYKKIDSASDGEGIPNDAEKYHYLVP